MQSNATRGDEMKILHTSDLHIGKRLMDRERLPEQIEVLEEIIALCEREDVSLVLIAGDVFDTYLPSAEAEEVFFCAVKKLAGKDRTVVIVSGNHDDGVRLAASAPLAEEHGVYIFGGAPRIFAIGGNRRLKIKKSGENWIIFSDGLESLYLNALPYPTEARLKEDKREESFPDKMKRWIQRGEEGYCNDMPHILLSHLFVAGGKTSESEREIDLGGARAVPVSVLPAGYTALGHLHRAQKIGGARYSGSILQYSFEEADTKKSVTLLETKGLELIEREIFLTSGKKLVRLECDGVEQALALLPLYQNCFIELTLRLLEPLSSQETRALCEANEGLVSLIPRIEAKGTISIPSRSGLNAKDLFREYYRSIYGEEPKDALLKAFLELKECEE